MRTHLRNDRLATAVSQLQAGIPTHATQPSLPAVIPAILLPVAFSMPQLDEYSPHTPIRTYVR